MTKPSNLVHLLDLPLHEAVTEKWRLGQQKYGPEFVGHPVAQLFEELLDSVNYCSVATAQGIDMTEMREVFWEKALEVQALWRRINS